MNCSPHYLTGIACTGAYSTDLTQKPLFFFLKSAEFEEFDLFLLWCPPKFCVLLTEFPVQQFGEVRPLKDSKQISTLTQASWGWLLIKNEFSPLSFFSCTCSLVFIPLQDNTARKFFLRAGSSTFPASRSIKRLGSLYILSSFGRCSSTKDNKIRRKKMWHIINAVCQIYTKILPSSFFIISV